jgi:hypothetical protein
VANDPFYPIVLSAADLKRIAPMQYELFVKSMQAYAERVKADLLAAGPDVIFPMQGKAQALDQLVKKLEDCFQLDENYRTRK